MTTLRLGHRVILDCSFVSYLHFSTTILEKFYSASPVSVPVAISLVSIICRDNETKPDFAGPPSDTIHLKHK